MEEGEEEKGEQRERWRGGRAGGERGPEEGSDRMNLEEVPNIIWGRTEGVGQEGVLQRRGGWGVEGGQRQSTAVVKALGLPLPSMWGGGRKFSKQGGYTTMQKTRKQGVRTQEGGSDSRMERGG
eukprot:755794-Hanusia_phi.AAC.2